MKNKIRIINNKNIYGYICEKLIKTEFDFGANEDMNSHEYVILISEKESNNVLFYAKCYDRDLLDAYISRNVYDSYELITRIAFYLNLKPPFFNKIYKYYV